MANGSLIFKTSKPGIYYSKINGTVALRPRCCLGPELTREEYDADALRVLRAGGVVPDTAMRPEGRGDIVTYLERVSKKDNRENPLLKDSSTQQRLEEIQNSRARRQLVVMHRQQEESAL